MYYILPHRKKSHACLIGHYSVLTIQLEITKWDAGMSDYFVIM